MPARSLALRSAAGLALLVALVTGCGTTPEEPTTTTTEVAAAAGSGFCLSWSRYQEAQGGWLAPAPETLEDAVEVAADSLQAAEEARSTAPEELEGALDVIVAVQETVGGALATAETLEEGTLEAAGLLGGPEITSATETASDWATETC